MMPDPYAGIRSAFYKAIPAELIEDILRLLAAEYRTAYEECKMFYPPEEAHDLRPHVRRAKIESKVRELAKSYPGVTATVEPNARRTGWHTVIRSGNVAMTISHVNQPSDMVRAADFRTTYAQDAQINMFGPDKPKPPRDATLFAILRHGASKRTPRRPDFVRVGFPDEDCTHYVCDINIFAVPRFLELASKLWPAKIEVVADELDLRLRSDAKKKKKKEEDEK
jgi:hypothetical protein